MKTSAEDRLTEDILEVLTQSLVSLSEIHLKRGKRHRHQASEWFKYNLSAVAYMKEAVYLCEKNEDLDEPGWKNMDIVSMKMRIEQKLKSTQENLILHLKGHLFDDGNQCIQEAHLEQLVEYLRDSVNCNEPVVENKERVCETRPPCPVSRENSLRKKPEKKIRTMDLNKIQKAITKLVRNITRDIRSRYRRKKLSEETMRRSVSCEIISLMSPISDDDELVSLFEQVIAEEDESEEPALELDIQTMQNGNRKSQNNSVNNSPRHVPKTELKVNLSPTTSKEGPSQSGNTSAITMHISSPPTSPHHVSSGVSGTSEENKAGTFLQVVEESIAKTPPCHLPGVLTLWKGYRNADRPNDLPFKRYKLMGYEEVSPLTESNSSTFTDMQPSPLQQITVHPLTVEKLYETFAHILILVGEAYRSESNYEVAVDMYKYALGLIYKCPKSNRNGVLVANVLKTLGIIKSCKGDVVAGCQLLDESMQVFKSLEIKDKGRHISEIWLELGKAYLMEKDHVTSLFGHIMSEVRAELDTEFKPESFEIPIPEESDDSDSSNGESYSLHVFEAIECLNSAFSELQKLDLSSDEHKCLFIAVLTKLGDCHMVTGNYDKAINNYEEAMGHCKHVGGASTIENNAHLLSMLGICNFLLGNYPKAATMLETASILQQHIYGQEATFGLVFTFTMLGLSFYKMRQYHKCIIWCIKSNDLNTMLYEEPVEEVISTLHFNRAWFIIQTLFTLGYAYYTLNFNEKAIRYLESAQCMVELCQDTDIKQHVKLLKVIADTFVNLDNHENALVIYEKALSIAASIGDEKSSVALQNQLLNCMAGVEVHVKHYSGAAEYLEQALDHQKHVQSNIKGDLIGLQYQLGNTYTMSGDIDKAIDCFEECLETASEMPGSPGKEMVDTYGKLASLYYVKGLMQEDNDYMIELLQTANKHFEHATCLDEKSVWNVHYANFLLQQDRPAEGIELMLKLLFTKPFRCDKEIGFCGLEQAILPEQLQNEADDLDDFLMDTKVFANFLAILCFRDLGLTKDADDCLINMYKEVLSSSKYTSYALMGYAFLETHLCYEAAECFAVAASLCRYNVDIAVMNSCICYCLHAFEVLFKKLVHIVKCFVVPPCLPKLQSVASFAVSEMQDDQPEKQQKNRDSGYFDNFADTEPEQVHFLETSTSSVESNQSRSKSDVLQTSSSHYESDSSFLTDQSMMSDDSAGYTSSEYGSERRDSLRRPENTSLAFEEEVWETIDESGNVLNTRVVRSQMKSSVIYEVENNGNYQTEQEYIGSLTEKSNEVYNDNYQASMSENVNTQWNENWSSSITNQSTNQTSPKRKLPETKYTYPNKYQNKSMYRSSFIESTEESYKSGTESDTEEIWETIEETVDTPPELLKAILASQGKA